MKVLTKVITKAQTHTKYTKRHHYLKIIVHGKYEKPVQDIPENKT